MIRKIVRRASKTILWISLFPWFWALGFGIGACGGAFLGVATPGWLWSWGIGTAIVVGLGLAGILHKPLDNK